MFKNFHDKCLESDPCRGANAHKHRVCPPDQQESDTQFILGLAVGAAIIAVYILCTSLADAVAGVIQQPTLF